MSTRDSFWRRQFSRPATSRQKVFDVVFGIALPLVCLLFDPLVFRSDLGKPLLDGYEIGGIGSMIVGMISLGAWLALGRFPAFIVGMLAGGAIFAFVLGCLLLPVSIVALFVVLGVLGFTPFATAFVFARNAVRAFDAAGQRWSRLGTVLAGICGLVVSVAGPWVTQGYVANRRAWAITAILSEDPTDDAEAIAAIKRFGTPSSADEIVFAYQRTAVDARRKRLAAAYFDVTGESIEDRIVESMD